MRKVARQGVPKRKPRDMAKPMAESGKTKDAPSVAPRAVADEPQAPRRRRRCRWMLAPEPEPPPSR